MNHDQLSPLFNRIMIMIYGGTVHYIVAIN